MLLDSDPHSQYGSGSRPAKWMRIGSTTVPQCEFSRSSFFVVFQLSLRKRCSSGAKLCGHWRAPSTQPWAFLSPGDGLVLMITLIWLDQTLGNKGCPPPSSTHDTATAIVCSENYILDDSADCVYLVQLFHLTWLDITLRTIFHSSHHLLFFKP